MSQMLDSTRRLFEGRRAAVRNTFDKRGRVRSSRREQVASNPRWKNEARDRRRKIQSQRFDTDALVRVGEDLTRTTLAILDRAAPAVSSAFKDHVVPIGLGVLERWPVDTGLSRSLYSMVFMPKGGTTFAAEQSNAAEYAFYVRFARRSKRNGKQQPKGRHVWTVLVRKPTDKAAKAMVRDIGARVSRG